jgi:phytoene dehydrogenase-like protein
MPRTPIFAQLARTLRIAHAAATAKVDAPEAVELARASETSRLRRRTLFKGALGAGGALLVGHPRLLRAGQAPNVDVAIIGAGIAGLAAADALDAKGIRSTVFEASSRAAAGACSATPARNSLGQVVELGGELIDTTHTTIRAYANELGLTLEDYNKEPGEGTWYADGRLVHEHEVVDEYRVFVDAMRDDLRRIGSPDRRQLHRRRRAVRLDGPAHLPADPRRRPDPHRRAGRGLHRRVRPGAARAERAQPPAVHPRRPPQPVRGVRRVQRRALPRRRRQRADPRSHRRPPRAALSSTAAPSSPPPAAPTAATSSPSTAAGAPSSTPPTS